MLPSTSATACCDTKSYICSNSRRRITPLRRPGRGRSIIVATANTNLDETAAQRKNLFNRIAPVYDELNDRLSFGQHWVWKQMTVSWSGAKPGGKVLDVCCGSGDLSFVLAKAVGPSGQVAALDFAAEMLSYAAQRQQTDPLLPGTPKQRAPIRWVQGDALALPFASEEFDAATMGYGLRNVADIPKALAELYRVLRPGASVAILDFNNSTNPIVDGIQGLFLERLVVPAATSYGLAEEYEYLRPSIKAFPTGREQEALARKAGFKRAVHYDIAFGLMGVLVATKAR